MVGVTFITDAIFVFIVFLSLDIILRDIGSLWHKLLNMILNSYLVIQILAQLCVKCYSFLPPPAPVQAAVEDRCSNAN